MHDQVTRSDADCRSIRLNGEITSTSARTIAALLVELGWADRKVATALNGTFVPARARNEQTIAPGDSIEVVTARQGG